MIKKYNKIKKLIIKYKYEIILSLIIIGAIVFFIQKHFNISQNNDHKIDINDILKNNYYINLDHRKDRKEETLKELKKIGITNPNRFNAIKHAKGLVGCGLSHLEVLKKAKKNNWDYVTIFEDDVKFLNPEETLHKLNKIINSNINWDVIILGGNNFKPYEIINEDCIKVNNCQCCTAYIVKKKYYETLINHWTEGLSKLIETNDESNYALDQYWKLLQQKDNFILITPVEVVQSAGYSDIEKKHVNYINLMKDNNEI
tara:strand:- start:613 stop:1386 length:774 start_codon:yes stop_codon:yes gene_type:complete